METREPAQDEVQTQASEEQVLEQPQFQAQAPEEHPSNAYIERKFRNYIDKTEFLSRRFHAFKILHKTFYFQEMRIKRIDQYYDHSLSPVVSANIGQDSSHIDTYRWLTSDLEYIATRIIMVEDLSDSVCLLLGFAFDLDPEFFVEHMQGQVPGVADGDKSHYYGQWESGVLKKPYLSLHWYRPMYRYKQNSSVREDMEHPRRNHRKLRSDERSRHSNAWDINVSRSASNILRSTLDLSTASGETAGFVAIEERASIYRIRRRGCQIIILLLDRVPEKFEATWQQPDEAIRSFGLAGGISISVQPLYAELAPRGTLDMAVRKFFSPSQSDNPSAKTVLSAMASLDNYFRHLNPDDPILLSAIPFNLIFCIVLGDTLGLLSIVNDALNDIIVSAASPRAALQSILADRAFTAQLQTNLPGQSLVKSLRKIMQAIPQDFREESTGVTKRSTRILKERVSETAGRVKEASVATMGALQYIESHRTIEEAESVSRLTEMAFFFIPLSFAASVFSMQVQEFANPVPTWMFIIVAFVLSASSYLTRLIVRSSWATRSRQSLFVKIRQHHRIPAAEPVPTSAFFTWFVHTNRLNLVLAFCVFGLFVPVLAVVWTRSMDNGLKAGLTVVFALILIVPPAVLWLDAGAFTWRREIDEEEE